MDGIRASCAPVMLTRMAALEHLTGKITTACRVLALAALGLAGVSPAAQADKVAMPVGIESVKLERTACHGSCPVYSVEVSADGTVRYVGEKFVAKSGSQSATVPREEVERLWDAIRSSWFSSLRSAYQGREDGCEGEVSRLADIVITVRSGGANKTVRANLGCVGPEGVGRIRWLAHAIDEAAGTRPWLGAAFDADAALPPPEARRTESFPLLHKKARDVVALLTNREHRMLSEFGGAVADVRTNTLFVQDTPFRLEEVRKLVRQLDVPGETASPAAAKYPNWRLDEIQSATVSLIPMKPEDGAGAQGVDSSPCTYGTNDPALVASLLDLIETKVKVDYARHDVFMDLPRQKVVLVGPETEIEIGLFVKPTDANQNDVIGLYRAREDHQGSDGPISAPLSMRKTLYEWANKVEQTVPAAARRGKECDFVRKYSDVKRD